MQRDFRSHVDFLNSLTDLCNANKIIEVKTSQGQAYIFNDKEIAQMNEVVELLARKETG